MLITGQTTLRSTLAVLTILIASQTIGPPVAVAQDKGAPPWGEFLRQGRWPGFDRLLRKPFREAPEEEVKGLAAKLRARELDIPNRKRAVKYLATFHCGQFPEARDMLVDVLLNDRWEPVRLEAAEALRDMFANCACDADENVTAEDRRRGAPDAGAARHCSCCCDANTLNALAKIAYETKENGCCFEPSLRVREMAVEAIRVCGIPCGYKPYMENSEQAPPAWEPVEVKDDDKTDDNREVVPPAPQELRPIPIDNAAALRIPTFTASVRTPTTISRLERVCIVSLKNGQQLTPSSDFASTYRGRKYLFASEAAKQQFDLNPDEYAVVFGGCDPVHFVDTKQVVEGRFLVLHHERFYMFVSEANYEKFQSNLARYTPGGKQKSQMASN